MECEYKSPTRFDDHVEIAVEIEEFLGGWLMSLLHIQKAGLLWELIVAVIGAVVLLFVISLFRKK